MSKEEKTEKEFEPIIVSEPRPRYGVLTDISLYIHPLSAPNIGEGDGYIYRDWQYKCYFEYNSH